MGKKCCLVSHCRVPKKKSGRYSLYTLKEHKTYGYIPELQASIVERRLSSGGLPRKRNLRPTDPRRLGLVARFPAPSIEELVRMQMKRGQGKLNMSFPKLIMITWRPIFKRCSALQYAAHMCVFQLF